MDPMNHLLEIMSIAAIAAIPFLSAFGRNLAPKPAQ
jgi:hypothetical protein